MYYYYYYYYYYYHHHHHHHHHHHQQEQQQQFGNSKKCSLVVLPATRLTQDSYFSASHHRNRSVEYYTCLNPACEEWIRFLRISTKAVHFSARILYVCKEIGKGVRRRSEKYN